MQCRIEASAGQCHSGYCSYPDPECPSGQRFHGSAPHAIADRCVGSTADDSGGSSATDASNGSAAGTTGWCGDGTVDPDEDCDDGNDRDGDGCNRDCHVSGEPIWERTFQGDDPGVTRDDRGYRVRVDGGDNVIVVGEAAVPDAGQNIFIRKYSPDGEEQWTKQPGKEGNDEAWALHVAPDDSFVVGGYVDDPQTGRDFWLARFDADGGERWQYERDASDLTGTTSNPDDPSHDEIRGVFFSAPDRIVVVGKSLVGGAENRFAAHGTADATGLDLTSWNLASEELPNEWDAVADIVQVDASYVLLGSRTVEAGGPKRIWLGSFDTDGVAVAEVTLDPAGWRGTAGGEGRRLWTSAGSIYMAGSVGGYETAADGYYGVFELGGELSWSRSYDGPTSKRDFAHGIAVDTEGNIIVVGESGGDPLAGGTETEASAHVWITKLAPDLSELWTDEYNGPENERDVAFDVVTDSHDAIIVVGYQSVAGNDFDLWVRKYRP